MPIKKSKRTWLVVADGAHARVFENEGPAMGLTALREDISEAARQPSREQGTGKPGRGFAPGAARHSFSDPADWQDQAKQEFARGVAGRLNKAAGKGRFDQLVIAAPPKTLGQLRAELSPQAQDLIIAEVAKDLTKIAVHDLPKYFEDIVRLS